MKVDRRYAKKTVKTVKTVKTPKKELLVGQMSKKTTSQITKSSTATENDKNPTRFGDQLFINPSISLIESAANRPRTRQVYFESRRSRLCFFIR